MPFMDWLKRVLNSPVARYHEVQSGDTLGKISKEYYGEHGKYMLIFNANRDLLTDPNKIQPGQRLRIPYI